MSAKVKPIPDGFHSVTPYLVIKGASEAIEFYKKAFGAVERFRLPGPDGRTVGHAEIVIGNSIVMLSDEFPEHGSKSPLALDAGAKVRRPLENQFYGDRAGCVVDPFGYQWTLMTHIEDMSPEEMKKRLADFYAKMGIK